MAKIRLKRGTNGGKGFLFRFADGYECWMLGTSAAEMKNMEREHGELKAQVPA